MGRKWPSSVVLLLWGHSNMTFGGFYFAPKLCHGRNAGWRKKWSPKVRSKSCELFHLLKWTSAKFARITSKVWSFGAPLPCVKLFFYHHFNLWGLSIVTEGIVTEGNLSTSLICIKEPDFSFLLLPFYSKITDFVSSINHLGQWHKLGKHTDIRGVFDTK